MDQEFTPVTDEILEDLLEQDPLAIAREVTGRAVDDDGGTADLGILIASMQHSAIDRQLRARGDTLFQNEVESYKEIIRGYRFEEVLVIPYVYDGYPDALYVYFHPELGCLLVFHTARSYMVEGSGVYYQWKPSTQDKYPFLGSGALVDGVWIGHMDAREALLFRLDRLRKAGTFVTPWGHFDGWKNYSPWLVHPGDGKMEEEEFDRIVTKRLSMLPKDVQVAIGLRKDWL